MAILKRFQEQDPLATLEPVAQPEKLQQLQQQRAGISISEPVRRYITSIVAATAATKGCATAPARGVRWG